MSLQLYIFVRVFLLYIGRWNIFLSSCETQQDSMRQTAFIWNYMR